MSIEKAKNYYKRIIFIISTLLTHKKIFDIFITAHADMPD